MAHKLKTYLKQNRITETNFAAQMGVHLMSISMIIRGVRHPSRKLALRIEQATGGAVTAMELLYPETLPTVEKILGQSDPPPRE